MTYVPTWSGFIYLAVVEDAEQRLGLDGDGAGRGGGG
jgi:hypothetical protein